MRTCSNRSLQRKEKGRERRAEIGRGKGGEGGLEKEADGREGGRRRRRRTGVQSNGTHDK